MPSRANAQLIPISYVFESTTTMVWGVVVSIANIFLRTLVSRLWCMKWVVRRNEQFSHIHCRWFPFLIMLNRFFIMAIRQNSTDRSSNNTNKEYENSKFIHCTTPKSLILFWFRSRCCCCWVWMTHSFIQSCTMGWNGNALQECRTSEENELPTKPTFLFGRKHYEVAREKQWIINIAMGLIGARLLSKQKRKKKTYNFLLFFYESEKKWKEVHVQGEQNFFFKFFLFFGKYRFSSLSLPPSPGTRAILA